MESRTQSTKRDSQNFCGIWDAKHLRQLNSNGKANPRSRRGANFPLHLKEVYGSIDWRAVLRLDMPEALRRYAQDVFRWLHDPQMYNSLNLSEGPKRTESKIKFSPKASTPWYDKANSDTRIRPKT